MWTAIQLIVGILQVSAERDSSNQANMALKAELDRYRDVTGNTVEALEREKAVKKQLETQNKAQVCPARCHPVPLQQPELTLIVTITISSMHL